MSKILSFLVPLAMLIIGIQFLRDYFGVSEPEKREKLELLVAQGQETDGILNSEYTEKVTKIRRKKIVSYEVGYKFKVGETEYTGTKSLRSPPTDPLVKVKYLPGDPNVNEIEPEAALASINSSKGDSGTLLFGLALALGGLGYAYYRYRSFKKAAQP